MMERSKFEKDVKKIVKQNAPKEEKAWFKTELVL
jgi:hypothetical protein